MVLVGWLWCQHRRNSHYGWLLPRLSCFRLALVSGHYFSFSFTFRILPGQWGLSLCFYYLLFRFHRPFIEYGHCFSLGKHAFPVPSPMSPYLYRWGFQKGVHSFHRYCVAGCCSCVPHLPLLSLFLFNNIQFVFLPPITWHTPFLVRVCLPVVSPVISSSCPLRGLSLLSVLFCALLSMLVYLSVAHILWLYQYFSLICKLPWWDFFFFPSLVALRYRLLLHQACWSQRFGEFPSTWRV